MYINVSAPQFKFILSTSGSSVIQTYSPTSVGSSKFYPIPLEETSPMRASSILSIVLLATLTAVSHSYMMTGSLTGISELLAGPPGQELEGGCVPGPICDALNRIYPRDSKGIKYRMLLYRALLLRPGDYHWMLRQRQVLLRLGCRSQQPLESLL